MSPYNRVEIEWQVRVISEEDAPKWGSAGSAAMALIAQWIRAQPDWETVWSREAKP